MSIIIQTGHPSSSSAMLIEMLYERGLNRANPSNVQKLSANQIADTLNKIIGRSQDNTTNKLADNLAVDFLLANIDQDSWGWEASSNLLALPYWASLDKNSRFVLVFDHPQKLLSHLELEELTETNIDTVMQEWLTYHSAMLDFWNKNQDKCVLLEGKAAIKKIVKTKGLLESLNDSLVLKSGWETGIHSRVEKTDLECNGNITSKLIVNELIKNYPKVISIFNVLLTKGDLIESSSIYKTKKPEVKLLVEALIDSKKSIDNLANNLEEKEILETRQLKETINNKDIVIKDILKELETLKIENKDINIELLRLRDTEKGNKELEHNKVIVENIQELENLKHTFNKEISWLTEELHKTQDLLEDSYNKNIVIEAKATVKALAASAKPVTIYHSPESRTKNDLPYRLGAAMIRTKTIKDAVLLPAVLTKEYHKFKEIEQELISLPALENANDILEVEKLRGHLSYKLGNTVTKSLESPRKFIALPLNISKEIMKFKK
ncbi:hypothetical protein [Psychrobacter sp. CAL346-MNA-CIBAN-0220]|uniref:hypothetical protein n=1 Tax=Psychrobacter sp. CAL346-MNA-CIBAN-0220 TaxID=3140457 RepID=UPI003327112A